MNRRGFFKALLGATSALALGPAVLKPQPAQAATVRHLSRDRIKALFQSDKWVSAKTRQAYRGLVPYDLQAPAKMIYPFQSPMWNKLPRAEPIFETQAVGLRSDLQPLPGPNFTSGFEQPVGSGASMADGDWTAKMVVYDDRALLVEDAFKQDYAQAFKRFFAAEGNVKKAVVLPSGVRVIEQFELVSISLTDRPLDANWSFTVKPVSIKEGDA